ncbi:zinc finger protein 804A isoform X2 [Elgaria multicarinata webbii]|uniref:zinc finger protein 804A isoform X2 n=1 Tax=Elgaria multicarinata webbii TaxID=159646 RepID=UPI002FCD44E6
MEKKLVPLGCFYRFTQCASPEPDYAEKENTIAKALEDLKANFYCELCDKQYYKHQEFDNHINSYDHAHKQRLKELKQREFARNVASKSRKDERKQEKALQRLHKLAELRKEAACAPGSGPMFRSTTVTVRDNLNGIPQRALIDSAKKEQEFNFALLHSSKTAGNLTSVASLSPESASNCTPDIKKHGVQIQGLHGHKVGFSFAFPKKAAVKLESSAAAFYEYNDETSAEHGLSRRSRFVPGPCNLQVSSTEEIVLCSEEKPGSIAPFIEKHANNTESTPLQDTNEPSGEENIIQEVTELTSPLSHSKGTGLGDLDSVCVNVDSAVWIDETPSSIALGNQTLPGESHSDEHLGNECTGPPVNEDCLSQPNIWEENDQNISSDSASTQAEIKKYSSDGLIPANSEGETIALPWKQNSQKRPCEPFVPVLNKHGSTILQWPSEMLIYTNTEPSVSYSCNPLCFDFRSSRLNECLEKNKPQSNMPNSSQKAGSSQGLVLGHIDESLSVNADCTTDISRQPCSDTTPVTMDVSLARSCTPVKNQDELGLGALWMTESQEKCHNPPKCIQGCSSANEQQNKVWIKRTHEKWFHKTRKRKRRRKLCHHHYEEMIEADADISPEAEQQSSCGGVAKHHKLPSTAEKGADENGLGHSVVERLQQTSETLGVENSVTISTSTQVHGNESPHPVWNTKDDKDCCMNSNDPWRRNKAISPRQSNKPGLNSGRCTSVYSRAFCSWNIRRSSSSPDHKHFGSYSDEKCTNQSQPVKRAYNSLSDESERSHRKRRHHMHSCSSDESSNAQSCFSEENLRQSHSLAIPCKAKRKRRRKRSRLHRMYMERAPRRNVSVSSPKEVSTFNHSPKQSTEENAEPTKNPSVTEYANNMEQTMQTVESQTASQPELLLSVETIQESNCSITEKTPYLEEFTFSASPVSEHSVLSTMKPRNILEEAEKHENVSVPEIQAPNKGPSLERNLDPPPPKAYLCHYEVAENIPQEKLHPSPNEWLRYNPGIFSAPPPLPFKEAHINGHAFITTEQILAPFTLPEHTLLLPAENYDKFKELQCEAYHQIIQQNMLASKMKLAFPPAAVQPSSAPLQPMPLQPPLCSTSVTTIHHTLLQQHAAAAAAAAAATTFKVLQPHQQFLSQVPTLSRTPLPHVSVGPRLCPAGHAAIVGPPQLPLLPGSVLHPSHLGFPPLPHTLFPSLLSPHPAVIPLQPLF